MGDMALEMAFQELHGKTTEGVKVGYPQEAAADVKRSPKRYLELLSRIQHNQSEIHDQISALSDRLEYVRDQSDSDKATMPQPAVADEPNLCTLDENLDEVLRENQRIYRRLAILMNEIKL
jgi:hypothetical protein